MHSIYQVGDRIFTADYATDTLTSLATGETIGFEEMLDLHGEGAGGLELVAEVFSGAPVHWFPGCAASEAARLYVAAIAAS